MRSTTTRRWHPWVGPWSGPSRPASRSPPRSSGWPAELAARDRGETEDRARRVGVQAAVPLGLCLLPAFVLLGIVPWVAGMVGALDW